MRAVLDTNVLLSAFFTHGVCEAVLDACINSDARTIILSRHILDEFARHAAGKFGATAADVKAAVEFLKRIAEIVIPVAMPANTCRDADDRPVIGTAVAGKAEMLVTGDAELLALGSVQGVRILSPRAFYDGLRKAAPPKKS